MSLTTERNDETDDITVWYHIISYAVVSDLHVRSELENLNHGAIRSAISNAKRKKFCHR